VVIFYSDTPPSDQILLLLSGKWDVLPLFIVKKLATLLGDHVYSSRLKTILGRPVFQDQYRAVPENQVRQMTKIIFL
jgi:hypothetical protein